MFLEPLFPTKISTVRFTVVPQELLALVVARGRTVHRDHWCLVQIRAPQIKGNNPSLGKDLSKEPKLRVGKGKVGNFEDRIFSDRPIGLDHEAKTIETSRRPSRDTCLCTISSGQTSPRASLGSCGRTDVPRTRKGPRHVEVGPFSRNHPPHLRAYGNHDGTVPPGPGPHLATDPRRFTESRY